MPDSKNLDNLRTGEWEWDCEWERPGCQGKRPGRQRHRQRPR